MATLIALTLAPGPLIAVLAARSASRDQSGACALALGICAGDVPVIMLICAGLGFWLQAHPEVFMAAKYAGVALLLWMAVRMWATSVVAADHPVPGGMFASGLTGFALCLSSPQTVVMYLLLLPRVADLTLMRLQETILLIHGYVAALLGVVILVIVFAHFTCKLLTSSSGVVLWTRGTSLAVAASAVGILIW